MKNLVSLILALMIFLSGVNTCAMAKKTKSDDSTKIVKEKVKKEKNTKSEKVKTEKIKKEKTAVEQVKKEKAPKVAKEKIKKEKKVEAVKEKKEKISKKPKKQEETKVSNKKKTKVKDLESMTQVEREKALLEKPYNNKKRSALAMYLNPNLDITEIRASHILVKDRKDALSIRKDILDAKISFEDAAKNYSLCPTGVNGGDLGYFNRKRMDQQFTDRAFDLKTGEISEPVGTRFGWHLIKVVDRR